MASATIDHRPIMHFPPELLRNIFIFSLPTRLSFRAEDAPMVLTHVCRTWRDVALSTPTLWSSINVRSMEDAPKAFDALLALWLTRAGSSPLDVIFPDYDERLLRTLAPYRAQVRRMEGWFPAALAADIGVNEMVNAEDVKLEFYSYSDPSVLDIGGARPSLRRLTIVHGSIDIRSVVVQPRLTHLSLTDGIDASVALEILVLVRTLEDVELEVSLRSSRSVPDSGVPKADKCVELRALKTLRLHRHRIHADIHLGYILDGISAPNLRVLETYGVKRALDGRDWTSLYNFLARSQAPLRDMTLREFSVTHRCLQAWLACCPQLEYLFIDCHACSGNVMPAPPPPMDETRWRDLLPSLQKFMYYSCDSECAALARLLESRSGVVLEDGSSGTMRIAITANECSTS